MQHLYARTCNSLFGLDFISKTIKSCSTKNYKISELMQCTKVTGANGSINFTIKIL